MEFSKLGIFEIFHIENFWIFPNRNLLEFSKLEIFLFIFSLFINDLHNLIIFQILKY